LILPTDRRDMSIADPTAEVGLHYDFFSTGL